MADSGQAGPTPTELHIHALEAKIRALVREKHDLQVRFNDLERTMHAVYGSRSWRTLEAARRVRRRKA